MTLKRDIDGEQLPHEMGHKILIYISNKGNLKQLGIEPQRCNYHLQQSFVPVVQKSKK